jgi:hypothetical protein
VLTSLGGKSLVQLNRDRAKELLPPSLYRIQGVDPSSAHEQVRAQLARLLSLPSQRTPLNAQILSSNPGRKLRIDEIQYESEPGIRIVGWFVRPIEGTAARPCVLYITDNLVNEAVTESSPLDEIYSHGGAICAINLRGMGLSAPRPPNGGPDFYRGMQSEEEFAWTNLVLGSPVIGQRVWDIMRAVDYLNSRSDVDASQIRILGSGSAGLAALMATTLDKRVRSALIRRALATYISVVDSEDYVLALDWFVPGILQHFDIPDITAAIYPRPVWIIDALNAEGEVLPESAVRERYSERISAASLASKELTIRTTMEDDEEVYIDWLEHS